MNKKSEKEIQEIEETQEALRESIDLATELTAKAQRLLQKHKANLDAEPGS